MNASEERIAIPMEGGDVSAVFAAPKEVRGAVCVAHGAGGSMESPFITGFAHAMNDAGFATLRFNFRYRERGRKAPDPEGVLRAAWVAAFAQATARTEGLPAFASGKSLGGRIASICVANGEMPARALVFLGYPLHPPGRPERIRDAPLDQVGVPMLFVQGSADPFARSDLLAAVVDRLPLAELLEIDGGDHSFRVRGAGRGGGGNEDAALRRISPAAAAFLHRVAGA
jgi:uncharacterized protein